MGCENSKIIAEGPYPDYPPMASYVDRSEEGHKSPSPKLSPSYLAVQGKRKTYPAGKAFIVSLNGSDEPQITEYSENKPIDTPILNKKPPKRLQQLIEKASIMDHTVKLQDLEDKMNKAEQRRLELLKQKLSISPK